jgi:hypothetical protein
MLYRKLFFTRTIIVYIGTLGGVGDLEPHGLLTL